MLCSSSDITSMPQFFLNTLEFDTSVGVIAIQQNVPFVREKPPLLADPLAGAGVRRPRLLKVRLLFETSEFCGTISCATFWCRMSGRTERSIIARTVGMSCFCPVYTDCFCSRMNGSTSLQWSHGEVIVIKQEKCN